MFKLLSELNIDNKNCKNLALLPGFNIKEPNTINEKFVILNKKIHETDIIDEKVVINLITQVNVNKNNLSRKKKNLKNLKLSRKKK